jgi:hypothetical protein
VLPEPAHDAVAMAPAGQLWSTLDDLARWTRLVCGDTGGVLRESTLAEMREPIVVDDGEQWVGGYGLGLQVARNRGRRLAGHTGSMPGFRSVFWAHPDEATGVVCLANTTQDVQLPALAMDLLDLLSTREPRVPREWIASPDVDVAMLDVTGIWYWGPAPRFLRLTAQGWLRLEIGEPARVVARFRPQGDGTWVGLEGYFAGETLRAVRRPDGTVSHIDVATFVFTRTPYDPTADVPGGVDAAGWRPHRGE